jgi:hypothetical protein
VSLDCPDEGFRRKLDEVTEAPDEPAYLALLKEALERYPNSIVRLNSPHPIARYTCGLHAFGFTEDQEYVRIAGRSFNRIVAGPAFVEWLIENQLLTEVTAAQSSEGALVVYFNAEGQVRHLGLNLAGHRVESKWGTCDLFQHEVFELPKAYGSSVRFFRRLSYEDAMTFFKRFAKENAMLFVD